MTTKPTSPLKTTSPDGSTELFATNTTGAMVTQPAAAPTPENTSSAAQTNNAPVEEGRFIAQAGDVKPGSTKAEAQAAADRRQAAPTKGTEASLPTGPSAESELAAKNRSNMEILGADQAALGGDRPSLTETSPAKSYANPVVDAQAEQAVPDNSAEGLARNKKISDARAFVRGQGVADHLYSDDSVIAEHERFQVWAPLNYGKEFKLNLTTKVSTYFHAPAGQAPQAVKSAEYATAEGARKPHYKDKEQSDVPTPSDPSLPN